EPVLEEAEKASLRRVGASDEAVTQQLGETVEARQLQARGFFKVAHLHVLLGEQTLAEGGYVQAVRLLEQLGEDFPDVAEYRHKLARSHENLGVGLSELGKRRRG